jgi:amino acid transporter
MSPEKPPPPGAMSADPEAAAELVTLGYHQELKRRVGFLGNLSLTLSDISPTASLLVVGPVVILAAGTGSLLVMLIGSLVSICIAFCVAELGSMFPVAGGLYIMTAKVLGRGTGFVALIALVGISLFVPAAVALGIGTYLSSLNANIPTNLAAGLVMAVMTLIALLQIRSNAIITGISLALELLVVVGLFFAGVTHIHQSASMLIHPVLTNGHGGLGPVGFAAIISAVAVAVFAIGGYEGAVNFSEETKTSASGIGKAVMTSAAVGIGLILIPFVAVLFGAPHLASFVASSTPFTDVARASFGGGFVKFLTIGAIIAILNAALALTLQYSRVIWASGRDRAWPEPVSSWIGKVGSGRGAPWVATLIVGGVGVVLCLQSSLVSVITFTGVLSTVSYGLVAVAGLVSRFHDRDLARPFRMPLWPLPAVIAVAGLAYALTQQAGHDLVICGAVFGVGILYYAFFLRGRPHYWSLVGRSPKTGTHAAGGGDTSTDA